MASQTLASKLGAAFWDAFARPGPAGASGVPAAGAGAGRREWDADKVRRVMEGTAVVRVVDVEPAPTAAPAPAAQRAQEKSCNAAMADLLAESMATLNLGRK